MNSPKPAPGLRYEALLQLLRTAETLWNASRAFFAQWDLSPSQFNVLNVLHVQPDGCTQSDLSRQLIMHRSNVTGLVDRLEKRGLLRREDHAKDRRVYIVVLTSAGRKLMRTVLPQYHRAADQVWGRLPIKRAEQLVAELEEVVRNAERIAKSLNTHANFS
jgi:MarR family 2-MHQ and catechol resistance regulon transcriptional repressor